MQGNQLKETASQFQPTQTAADFSDYTYCRNSPDIEHVVYQRLAETLDFLSIHKLSTINLKNTSKMKTNSINLKKVSSTLCKELHSVWLIVSGLH